MQAERPTRLHDQLATMVALEQSLELRSGELLHDSIEHEAVASVLERIHQTSQDRRLALTTRLEAIAPDARTPDPVTSASTLEVLSNSNRYRAYGPLLAAHALLTQAVMGYAVLLELAFRAADSTEHLGPENTGDIAWAHMRACAALSQEVARMIPYVVVDELEEEGMDCRCTCPTCALGVCACPLAFRRRLDTATVEAGPTEDWPGVGMVRPRAGSPAATAGLAKDDLLVRIDGKVIDSIPMLQESIKAHPSGETIQFEVQRVNGTSEAICRRAAVTGLYPGTSSALLGSMERSGAQPTPGACGRPSGERRGR